MILRNYTLIGNSRAAALVCKSGSIDWCCLPEFDSPALFAALLDEEKGGHFTIRPIGNYSSEQRYLPDTNVSEIVFETEQGTVKLLDAFTAQTEEQKTIALQPDHEILRCVEGVSGSVTMQLEYVPRLYYGKLPPKLKNYRQLGIQCTWKENIYSLHTTLPPEQLMVNETRVTATFTVHAGKRVLFALAYSSQSPAIIPELKQTGWYRMRQTVTFWQHWIADCNYSGLYLEQIKRSALTLKLLSHAPSGAIVAAPTTSLPESEGGGRNWDYRYCWLRDASFTVRALVKLGFRNEANAYLNWILHATRLTQPKLQVVYSVFGHATLKEKTLDWLRGYRNSKPVRIGNGADKQFQLDVYGEVLDAIYVYAPFEAPDRATQKFALGLGNIICKLWHQPDNGIWEIRSSIVRHTHSLVMAWVGLDRLIKLAENYSWKDVSLEKYRQVRAAIQATIEQQGYNTTIDSYTHELSGDMVDASLLTLSLSGYCNAASPRMLGTTRLIIERLSENDLLYRYRSITDGLTGDEGAFVICNFWLAENLARAGELEKAMHIFETTLQHASYNGLLSEEINPHTHELLGNYPQGFSHIGLISAALAINEVYKQTTVNA
ncbi:glycoside hydrolase family 15 protein [Pontibacter burrus]|uniref:Glycoside hydrolase family 15 protein n=1 Tax=Pontibacter burrus TaxID=2704466 RepID=A0A6B3LTW7_9BACT|nr:glycoside hydrolase family 15 protein [Pontibacter burrus]NEM97696.1 glycoside hydrolase family 15 protein [Pontibacter burrus]